MPVNEVTEFKNVYEYQKTLNDGSVDDTSFLIIIAIIIFSLSLLFLYILIIALKGFFRNKRHINIDNKHLIKKPIFAPTLSLLFPGFGQIYNGEFDRGVIYTTLTLLSCLILLLTWVQAEGLVQANDLVLKYEVGPRLYFYINTLLIIFLIFIYINSIIDAYSTAIAINRKLLPIVRQNEDKLLNLMKSGRALFKLQNYKDAVALYTAIISLHPTYAMAHYNRAVVYYKIHEYVKAGNDFIAAAKLGHEKAQRILINEGIDNFIF
jgi:tetratricopeptide (TPR) repeat protein